MPESQAVKCPRCGYRNEITTFFDVGAIAKASCQRCGVKLVKNRSGWRWWQSATCRMCRHTHRYLCANDEDALKIRACPKCCQQQLRFEPPLRGRSVAAEE